MGLHTQWFVVEKNTFSRGLPVENMIEDSASTHRALLRTPPEPERANRQKRIRLILANNMLSKLSLTLIIFDKVMNICNYRGSLQDNGFGSGFG